MIYCIEVIRGGIGEENFNMHVEFDTEPTREEVLNLILDEDCGYDDKYCKFEYYKVG